MTTAPNGTTHFVISARAFATTFQENRTPSRASSALQSTSALASRATDACACASRAMTRRAARAAPNVDDRDRSASTTRAQSYGRTVCTWAHPARIRRRGRARGRFARASRSRARGASRAMRRRVRGTSQTLARALCEETIRARDAGQRRAVEALRRATSGERGRGVYLHGRAGRGKTALADGAFAAARRREGGGERWSWHALARRAHEAVGARGSDGFYALGRDWFGRWVRVVMVDEIEIADVGDAVVRGRGAGTRGDAGARGTGGGRGGRFQRLMASRARAGV